LVEAIAPYREDSCPNLNDEGPLLCGRAF
jgi:hypothetical protein